jgi:signal transduction histidine kinase
MNLTPPRDTEPTLADAFATFASAAGQLEFSYRELQKEITRLRRELEARNAAVAETLTENQSMRMALRSILDTLPCGVTVLDATGEILFLNVEARRQFDAGRLAAGQTHQALLTQISATVILDGEEKEIAVSGDGGTIWLAVRSSKMNSPYSVISSDRKVSLHGRAVLITRDITVQKKLQQDRDDTQHLIALAKMSAVLAHEIRNPLASMELLVGLLYGADEIGTQQRSWVDGLRAGVRSLSATVNNVLRYHSLGTADLIPIQLVQALRESVQFVQPLAKQAGISLLFSDELGDQQIAGNAGELQQVVFNLTLNAFRHTPKSGTVKVRTAREVRGSNAIAVVEVQDTGEGIREADLPHVFEAGFSASGQNPGLGLAVCKKIVELHRGTISVSSQAGSGCTFRMEFPLYE